MGPPILLYNDIMVESEKLIYTMKSAVFWDMTSYKSLPTFRRNVLPHFLDSKSKPNKQPLRRKTKQSGFFWPSYSSTLKMEVVRCPKRRWTLTRIRVSRPRRDVHYIVITMTVVGAYTWRPRGGVLTNRVFLLNVKDRPEVPPRTGVSVSSRQASSCPLCSRFWVKADKITATRSRADDTVTHRPIARQRSQHTRGQ
jgi:hypothetical protein